MLTFLKTTGDELVDESIHDTGYTTLWRVHCSFYDIHAHNFSHLLHLLYIFIIENIEGPFSNYDLWSSTVQQHA